MIRLNLWSSPRNISTAIMYSFAQRKDTVVVDEPLYAHYLVHQPTQADHPGREETLASQENDGHKVIDWMLNHPFPTELVVFKQMTHHLVNLTEDFKVAALFGRAAMPDQIQNILLIRDPRAILASFSKVVENVTAEDIGLPQQYTLFKILSEKDRLTAILDARRLLLNPQEQLKTLCGRIGIPFDEQMLNWPAGPRPEDGVWAKYWYANVHKSTGFKPYQEKVYQLSDALEEIAKGCMPLYREMLAVAN